MKEQLLILFGTAFASIEESKLLDVFQKLHDRHPLDYEAAMKGLALGIKAIQPIITETKTPIDDLFVSALNDAIVTSAKNNNVTL